MITSMPSFGQMIIQNAEDNVIIQPQNTIYVIILQDDTPYVKDNVIIEPDDNTKR
jgi:hypothetical protein